MSWGYLLVRCQKRCDISRLHEGISWSVTESNIIYHIYMRTWSGVPKRIYNLLHNEGISWSGTPFGGSLHWHWAAWPDQQDWQEDQVSCDDHNGLIIWWSLVMDDREEHSIETLYRFRRKKKEKMKTENRAKKALKTISLILGAFVTCWTPYHILAIIRSAFAVIGMLTFL